MNKQFRAGRIDFINTVPVYAGADQGRISFPGMTTRGTPADLNRLMREKALQISAISSVEYAYAYPNLTILPGISISCSGPVHSVLLYAKIPLTDLTGTVGLSNRSASARALVPIILEDFFGRKVAYRDVDMERVFVRDSDGIRLRRQPLRGLEALLVIGDDALSSNLRDTFPFTLDLGEFWVERTGHPFVFGLWAAQGDFVRDNPDTVEEYRACLLKSLGFGLKEMDTSIRMAADRSTVSEDRIRTYLERIDYFLGPHQIAGMRHFFSLLKRRGEIHPAVELNFFERPRERGNNA